MAAKILVVDDNLVNLKLVHLSLMHEGYEVLTARGGEEALTVLEHNRPDLILMDIQMPSMDGITVTRRIKADPATRDVPVVALTAHAMKGDAERILENGFDGYLAKPFELQELVERVAAHLKKAGA